MMWHVALIIGETREAPVEKEEFPLQRNKNVTNFSLQGTVLSSFNRSIGDKRETLNTSGFREIPSEWSPDFIWPVTRASVNWRVTTVICYPLLRKGSKTPVTETLRQGGRAVLVNCCTLCLCYLGAGQSSQKTQIAIRRLSSWATNYSLSVNFYPLSFRQQTVLWGEEGYPPFPLRKHR